VPINFYIKQNVIAMKETISIDKATSGAILLKRKSVGVSKLA